MVLVQPRQLWSNLPRFIPQSGTTFPSVLKCSQTILGHVALFPGHAHFLTVFVCLPQCVTCAIAPGETTFQLSYQNNSQILYNIPICSKVFPNHLRTCSFIPRTCTLYDRLCLSASMCHLVLLLQPRQLLNDHTRLNTQSCTTFPIVRKCSLTISGHVVLFPGHANFLTVYVSLPQCVM